MIAGDTSETIFAVSSGQLPSGIAVIRISGASASVVLSSLAVRLPVPRFATLAWLCDPIDGKRIDQALVLWLPGPKTVTGEDVAELHVHGSRAVVARTLTVIAGIPRVRPALAGEFTRRAFLNGRIDLAQAEGLSDLLAAETEWQRQSAMRLVDGGLGQLAERWRIGLLNASARIEALIEFSDEDDLGQSSISPVLDLVADIVSAMSQMLAASSVDRIRDGVRVVLLGPPNAGKSSLLNALVAQEAAIVSPIAGTTRDRIEVSISIEGMAFVFVDTAGLHDDPSDDVESIGIARAREASERADILLWLGDPALPPMSSNVILVSSKADIVDEVGFGNECLIRVSAVTGQGLADLRALICERARAVLPRPDAIALNVRHRQILNRVVAELKQITSQSDHLLVAEAIRLALRALDELTGRATTEDMLDALFGTFCIGK